MAKPPPLLLLVALVAFGPMSIDLYLPSLPDIGRYFHADVAKTQQTLAVFVSGFALAQLVYGPLSDRFGRRPVLLGGVSLYLLSSLLCLFASSIDMLILGRFLQALGGCSGPVLARAIVRDTYPRDQSAKVMATMASVMALAPAVAPLIGGNLHAAFGWRANFGVLVGFGAFIIGLGLFALKETNLHPDPRALRPLDMLSNYAALLRDRVFLGYTLTLSFLFSGLFAFISGGSFVLIDVLGVRPEHFGLCFTVVIMGFLSGSLSAARLTGRIGLERMVALGVPLGAVAGLVMVGLALAGIQTIWAVILPMAFCSASAGLTLPNGTAAAIGPHARIAGSASALLGFMQMGIAAGAGWLVGQLHNGTSLPMAAVIAAMMVIALITHRLLVSPIR